MQTPLVPWWDEKGECRSEFSASISPQFLSTMEDLNLYVKWTSSTLLAYRIRLIGMVGCSNISDFTKVDILYH